MLERDSMKYETDDASVQISRQGTGETIIAVSGWAYGSNILQLMLDDTVDISGNFEQGFHITRKKDSG